MIKNKTYETYILLLCSLILVAIMLVPYSINGFWFDDALNSQVHFFLNRINQGLGVFSFKVFWVWLTTVGRPMAGFFYGYSLFYIFSDLQALRIAHVVSTLINVLMFAYVFRIWGVGKNYLILWICLLVGLFQVRGNLDPIAAFAFHYQILGMQLCACLIFLAHWTKTYNNKYLVISMLFWFLSLICYEINIIFLPLLAFIVFKHKKIRSTSFIILIPSIMYFIIITYLRSHSVNPYQGTAFGSVSLFLNAYIQQLSSALPALFYLKHGYSILPLEKLFFETLQSQLALILFIVGGFLFYQLSGPEKTSTNRSETAWVSLMMLFLPPVFPAISARYQTEINWGLGVLPVYYQYFGLAFFGVHFIYYISNKSKSLRLLISFILAFYISINFSMNNKMVEITDHAWREPRDSFARQSIDGLFSSVKNGDIVEIKDLPNFINANLIYQWSGKNVFVPSGDHSWFPESPEKNANKFVLSRNSNSLYEITLIK